MIQTLEDQNNSLIYKGMKPKESRQDNQNILPMLMLEEWQSQKNNWMSLKQPWCWLSNKIKVATRYGDQAKEIFPAYMDHMIIQEGNKQMEMTKVGGDLAVILALIQHLL